MTTQTTLSDTELEALTTTLVDARGMGCPGPLLEAKKGMGRIPVGSTVELISTDPVTKSDVAVWAAKVGHEFLGVLPGSGYDRVFIRRGK